MKKVSAFPSLLLSAICALGLMTCVVSGQLPESLSNNLIAYYTFDGNYLDNSGNSNNLTIRTAGISLTTDQNGNPNSALFVTSSADYAVSDKNLGIFGNGPFSISLWLKMQNNNDSPNLTVLNVANDNNSAIGGATTFVVNTSSALGGFNIAMYGGGADTGIIAATDVPAQWNMYTFVYNGSLNTSRYYINGIYNSNMWTGLFNVTEQFDLKDSPLTLGYVPNIPEVGLGVENAALSDVAVWGAALSDTQVSDLYQIQSVPEPSTYALLLLSGTASLWALKRRRS